MKSDMERNGGFAARLLARYALRYPVRHGLIIFLVTAAVAASVGTQYGVKLLVDALSPGAHAEYVLTAFVTLLALIAGDTLFWRIASWIAHPTFVAVTGDLRRDLFANLTEHTPSYFTTRPVGSVTSRVAAASNAAFAIENMLSWNVLPPALATLIAIAFLANVSGTMALALVPVAASMLVVLIVWAARGQRLHHSFADRAARVDGELSDILGNFALMKSFGSVARERARFHRIVDRELKARRRSLFYLERIRITHAIVTVMLTFGLLFWALRLWQQGLVSAGDVVMVTTLALSVLHATRDLAVAFVDATQHFARFGEALAALQAPRTIEDAPHAAPLQLAGASVSIRRVNFSYPGARPLFKDLTLDIRQGERVALTGQSGGGKSTLFALLQRFYDVQSGVIRFNGIDIRDITQESLRQAIAAVPQEPSLFNRTLLENIRYARPSATLAQVQAAASAAGCDTFIPLLSAGLHTRVGERGSLLSGGQKQRVAIARAFLKDAPLLLLDEATSALDPETEAKIRTALLSLMKGRTVIAIAHRPEFVAYFDRVITLDSGHVVRDGAHAAMPSRGWQTPVPETEPIADAALLPIAKFG